MKILKILFLFCFTASAKTNIVYTIIQGKPENPIFKTTNCINYYKHADDCYLITYIENSKTNEYHAWVIPITVITNK